MGAAGGGRRPLGRRRRRLYWTVGLLCAAAVAGTALGLAALRAQRAERWRGGADDADITRRLDMDLPDEAPDPIFDDVTEAAGLAEFRAFAGNRTSQLPEDMGSGAAWGDYDGDGDDDLFLVAAGGPMDAAPERWAPSMLFANRGDGTFARVASFPDTRILGMGAAWGDYDGDGDADLIVSGFGALRLFRNDAGTFVRDAAIDDRPGYWAGVSWADFDRDGDLDLYVCGYVRYRVDESQRREATMQYGEAVPFTLNPASFEPERNLLFVNRGDGRFDERAEELGVDNPKGRSLAALWRDLDDDGWVDLYVANDISDNVLLLNREGRFEDASHSAWVADYRGAMGLAAGDWNRDGDDDLFVTHWVAQENALYDSLRRDLERRGPTRGGSASDGDRAEPAGLRFMDVADQRGLGQIALQKIGWGVEFADFDGDGWLDLAIANGSTFETDDMPPRLRAQAPFLFWNHRGETFHDLAPLDAGLARERVGRGLALADYDLDGDVDLLIVDRDGGADLYRNGMQTGTWIELRLLDGRGGGAASTGARVTARVGELALRRAVGGVSYLSQSSATLHLGLGRATAVDELEVDWPDGRVDRFEGLAAGAIWELRPGGAAPRRVAPVTTLDREATLRFWTAQRAAMRTFKVDGDPAAAIPLFEQALAIDPRHGDSLYYLANCLAETGDVAGALDRLAELMRLDPLSHRAHKRWGVLRASTATTPAELDEAEAALERAHEINLEETGVLHALGEVALMRGDAATARGRFELELRTNSTSTPGLFMLGYSSWMLGEAGRARSALEAAAASRVDQRRPAGVVAEGDVRRTMHAESTPLAGWVEGWDGTTDPAVVFAGLDARPAFSRRSAR